MRLEETAPAAYGEIVGSLADEPARGSRAGEMRERLGVTIVSPDPRERWLVRDDDFNLAFALQETFAYWNGLNPGHVQRYNSAMEGWMVNGELPGSAYGDRMRNTAGHDQIERAVRQLRENPDTRRAYIAVHQPAVEDYGGGDVACTAYLQLLLRDGELHMVAGLRSQDVYWGYPYDQQNNQSIQELVAGRLGADLGRYHHRMNSCHYYTEREDDVLASAEVAEARGGPDLALPEGRLGTAMGALGRGLERARAGEQPWGQANTLLDVDTAGDHGWADWLLVVSAYELARHHGRDVAELRNMTAAIETDWWRGWTREAVERHAGGGA